MPHVLLHLCCAPCATYPLEVFKDDIEVTGFFSNSNIQPHSEYEKRLDEARRFFEKVGVPFIEDSYNPEGWSEAISGLENEPERGKRCEVCFRVRLSAAAQATKRLACDSFTTTLTVSRHKNSRLIHQIGKDVAEDAGVRFLDHDFKKRGGSDRCIELSRKWGLYRQDYCGCIYSKKKTEKAGIQYPLTRG